MCRVIVGICATEVRHLYHYPAAWLKHAMDFVHHCNYVAHMLERMI